MLRPDNKCTYKDFIEYMNELYRKDPKWLMNLISHRPHCNKEIAVNTEVQCGRIGKGISEPQYGAGLLGIINGFYGSFEDENKRGCGPVAACFDDDTEELRGFMEFGSQGMSNE